MKTVNMKVEGMHCDHCVSRVRSALEEVAGVEDASVSLDEGRASVRTEDSADEDALVRAVDDVGYSASVAGA